MVNKYEVEYDKDQYVVKIHSIEEVESDDEEVLEAMEEYLKELYKNFDGIKYYEYNIKNKNNKITSEVNVDYSKIDLDKFFEIDDSLKEFFDGGHMSLESVRGLYVAMGAKCEK